MTNKPQFVGERVRLGDVLRVVNGKNQKAVEDENGQYPIYGSGGQMGWANSYICPANTVIIGRKGNINKPLYVSEPFWNVDTAFGLVAKPELLHARYLYHYCKHYDFEKLNTTCTIPSLTRKNVEDILLYLPSLKEQEGTAAQFDSILKQITLAQQLLSKLDSLVKSRFVEMFGDPVKCTKWKRSSLADLCSKLGSGATPRGGKSAYKADGIPLIRSMNVHNGHFESKDLAYIDDNQAEKLKGVTLVKGDVLLNITGASVARSCLLPDELVGGRVNQHVSIVRPNQDKMLPTVLNAIFISDSYQNLLLNGSKMAGATREAITKDDLEKMTVPLPPLALQQEFAAFVAQVDKSRFAYIWNRTESVRQTLSGPSSTLTIQHVEPQTRSKYWADASSPPFWLSVGAVLILKTPRVCVLILTGQIGAIWCNSSTWGDAWNRWRSTHLLRIKTQTCPIFWRGLRRNARFAPRRCQTPQASRAQDSTIGNVYPLRNRCAPDIVAK